MSSSAVKTYNPNLSDIITKAYRKAGIIALVETASSEQLVAGREQLNLMVSEWMKLGHKTWTYEEAILFLQQGQARYELGSTSTAHVTDAYDFAQTALAADAAAAATAMSVGSITNIANGDYVGVALDDGSMHWTTVNGAPSGTTVTLAAGLPSAASEGAVLVAYTTKIIRPLKISSARRYYYADRNETPADEIALIDYMALPQKDGTASPFTQWMYQPKIPLGVVNVWQAPADVTYAMRFTYQRPIFDFVSNADTADLPIEWVNALIYGLAVEMIPDGNVPEERAMKLINAAAAKLSAITGADREQASIMFQPDV